MDKTSTLFDIVMASYVRIGSPDQVLLALSGGADSLALLFVLKEMKKEADFYLSCVHVNHHLRPSSVEEAKWLHDLCEGLKIPLSIKDVVVPLSGSLEDQARKVRYKAFQQVFLDTNAMVLALAHHADDQAETMLMRLMHGTGPAGLAAMREKAGWLWRPLLQTPKSMLLSFLNHLGRSWIEDASNHDPGMLRNAIRMKVMPEIEALSPGTQVRMAKTAQLLHDEDEAWATFEERWLKEYASINPPMVFLLTEPFLREPLAFRRRLVRRLCAFWGIHLDSTQTNTLCALPNKKRPGKMNLPGGASALCTASRLHISPQHVADCPEHLLMGRIETIESPQDMGDGKRKQTFDVDLLSGSKLRCVLPGDMIMPFGMNGTQKMAQYLSDRKIDQPFRKHWPVLARGNQVLWAIGLGMAQTAAVSAATKQRVQYVYKGLLPGELRKNGGQHHE
jgi:tRNA(Ile)-lysidine synthase